MHNNASSKPKKKYFRWEVLTLLLVLLAVAIHDWKSQTAFRVFIEGGSMLPTFQNNEMVLATSLYPKIVKDDVVIIMFNNEYVIIKRVKYVPGDVFWVLDEGERQVPIPDDVVEDLLNVNIFPIKKIEVPLGYYWIEGDNVNTSEDSRTYGLVEEQYIRGVVSPWRKNLAEPYVPFAVNRIYQLRKQGRAIKRENIISSAYDPNL